MTSSLQTAIENAKAWWVLVLGEVVVSHFIANSTIIHHRTDRYTSLHVLVGFEWRCYRVVRGVLHP